jgi:membrane protein implicated in regulation of membrane protease activity
MRYVRWRARTWAVTALYLFFAGVGVPLVIWSLVAGGGESELGEADGGGGDSGPLMLRLLPLSSLALAAATFGITGLVLGALDVTTGVAALSAAGLAVVAAVLNSAVFAYVRRTESTSDISDASIAGAIGRVVVPVEPGRRGRVVVSLSDRDVALTAQGIGTAETLAIGSAVVVVEMERGIARVARLELPEP